MDRDMGHPSPPQQTGHKFFRCWLLQMGTFIHIWRLIYEQGHSFSWECTPISSTHAFLSSRYVWVSHWHPSPCQWRVSSSSYWRILRWSRNSITPHQIPKWHLKSHLRTISLASAFPIHSCFTELKRMSGLGWLRNCLILVCNCNWRR